MKTESSLGNIVERIFLGRLFSLFKKPERLSTREYAETYRWLGSEVSAKPGKMDCLATPFMLKVMQAMDDINVKVIVARKSAQVAWSETQNSYIAKRMHLDPQNIVMAFPREASAKSYSNEKIKPLIKSIPALLSDIGDPDKCSFAFFKFTGGFLKLVTAGSATALKSTSAPILIVEEPDDLKEDLKGQGDALTIFVERQKTFEERKLIYGGTPSEEGFSKVHDAYEKSNRMVYMVPCHACGQAHVLDFNNLKCDPFQDNYIDPTYGKLNPETAYYECPFCAAIWDDEQKRRNILAAVQSHDLGWLATAESDIVGFAFNELMSSFPGSSLVALAKKKLEAENDLAKGKEGKMKAFTNNSMGLAYAPKSAGINVKELRERRLAYEEKIVPLGGIVLTCGIDVQHNRFAIIVRAWGRRGNSWLVYWGELHGYIKDPEHPVWAALTTFVTGTFAYTDTLNGQEIKIPISAVSIDSGDGGTTELVYSWVLQMAAAGYRVYATKGSSELGALTKEIFNVPVAPEAKSGEQQRKSLAERMGVNVYIVGTQQAKEEVLRKLALSGNRDRSYHYEKVRDDYEEQLLSNVKRLSPSGKDTRYELLPGKRDEALDGEVLALHAARAISLHLWQERHWQQAEKGLLRNQLTAPKAAPVEEDSITPGVN